MPQLTQISPDIEMQLFCELYLDRAELSTI